MSSRKIEKGQKWIAIIVSAGNETTRYDLNEKEEHQTTFKRAKKRNLKKDNFLLENSINIEMDKKLFIQSDPMEKINLPTENGIGFNEFNLEPVDDWLDFSNKLDDDFDSFGFGM